MILKRNAIINTNTTCTYVILEREILNIYINAVKINTDRAISCRYAASKKMLQSHKY